MRTILPLLALAACTSEHEIIAQGADPRLSTPPTVENPVQEDRVVQVVVPEVDILFVVDNSSSMGNEQTQLHTNFPLFLEHFVTAGLDYHIGMVSTDMQRANHSGKLRTGFGYRYIDLDTVDPGAVFDAMTASLGVHVGSVEKGRAPAYTALELIRDEPTNVDFLRPEADLHIIFVSDDEDQSGNNPISKPEFIDWAQNLKSPPASVTMHGIVTPQQNCGSGNITGASYLDYAAATGGVTYSICLQDWAPALDALGLQTAGLKREFFLSRVPVMEPDLLLEVKVITVDPVSNQELTLTFETCLVGEETETCEVVYYPGRNSIVFLEYVPDPLSEVIVTYPMAEAYTAGVGQE